MSLSREHYLKLMGIDTWQLRPRTKEKPQPRLMLISAPFAKPAGRLLDAMLETIGHTRQSVELIELPEDHSAIYLTQRITDFNPTLLVTLGNIHATHSLNIPLIVTYHPDELLKTPKNKAKAYADLQLIMQTLNA